MTAGVRSAYQNAAALVTPRVEKLKVKFDPLRLALFLLILINVSRIHQNFHFIARMHPAQILVMVTAVYAFLNPKKLASGSLLRYWIPRWVLALAVWSCISTPFGISLGAAAKYILEEYSKTIIFFFLLIAAIRGVKELYVLVWGYVVASAILAWMALFMFGISRASGSYVTRLSSLYTYDANDIGCVFMVGLACTILMFQASKGRAKLFAGIVILGIGAALARSGSRGAFLGLAVFGIALLVLLRMIPIAKRVGFLLATVLALVVAAPPGYWEQMGTLLAPKQDYNWSTRDGRKQVWTRGIGYMLDYPIFGLGIGNFDRAECMISTKAKTHILGTGLRCTPPHNSFLEAGAELGLPGLIMFTGLVFGGIFSMFRLRKRIPAAWLHGDSEQRFLYLATLYFAVGMLGFATTAFFLTFAWLDIIYILLAFMTGLYVAVDRKLREAVPVAMPAPQPARSQRLLRRR